MTTAWKLRSQRMGQSSINPFSSRRYSMSDKIPYPSYTRRWLSGLRYLTVAFLALSSTAPATAIDLTTVNSGNCSSDRSILSAIGQPVLFAPETSWPAGSDNSPAFTPDGQTVFFTHSVGAARKIMVSHQRNGAWSLPEVADFSGIWRDIEPAMAPDGSYLVFISNRPLVAGGDTLTGFWAGASRPGAGGNIWRVNREGDGWGKPVRLPDIVNSNSAIYSPAIARDGSIYFNQPDPVTRKSHIYRAQATPNGFMAPKALSISDGTIGDFDAAVAPDESFIVFSSGRAPAKDQQALLFVSYSQDGHWTLPRALEPAVEGLEARFSPDLRTLYFSAEVRSATTGGIADSTVASRIFQLAICGFSGHCAKDCEPVHRRASSPAGEPSSMLTSAYVPSSRCWSESRQSQRKVSGKTAPPCFSE
ncbi:MAG: hypothetical protein V4508_04020 [Pseudomonadota bacterium]